LRITQILIRNFRGISKEKLPLPGHVVFIGDNKSGKSSVIEQLIWRVSGAACDP
jgi:putative ATP-dependent endonuclease of OLD family